LTLHYQEQLLVDGVIYKVIVQEQTT
jgi:hypothetical protein